ncbi:MAG: Putative response regulator [uncultured Corynebacteriales bacterium]|uniref:Response regulator n=1 Tax=uncultured Mycobacteriales bacterium TaxID=581187 RepID=A0A6J4K1G4_9ACTN|nr:MAG: Putative response regulator [uncultured Corynebacteriales bacterium]
MGGSRVLLADDDPTVRDVVCRYLERDGLSVETVADGRQALDRAVAAPPDLLVLDLMLPGLGGLEVCRRLRAAVPVPVILLTALGSEDDRVRGLELGADDYVTKPFSPRELTLRVRSVLRRAVAPPPRPVVLLDGDLVVDVAARVVTAAGRAVELTVREFDLLAFLLGHPRQAHTRAELLDRVWGWTYADHATVTVHVRRLREKLAAAGLAPRVATVWGVGYRYDPLPG